MTPIRCQGCLRENSPGNTFCIFCGTQLETSAAPPEEPPPEPRPQEDDPSVDSELVEVRQELRALGQLLDRLQDRISRLEMSRPGAAPAQPQPPMPTAAPGASRPSSSTVPPSVPGAGPAGLGSPPSVRPRSFSATLQDFIPPIGRGFTIDWEQVLGKNWFAIVGALALTIGAGFFLLARAVFPVEFSQLPFVAGAFALAWTVGFFAVFAPGGLGVRESVLVLALEQVMPAGPAIVLTALGRLWWMVGEIGLLMITTAAVTLARRSRCEGGLATEAKSLTP